MHIIDQSLESGTDASHCTASFHLRDIRLSAVDYFDSDETKELRLMMSHKGQEMRL